MVWEEYLLDYEKDELRLNVFGQPCHRSCFRLQWRINDWGIKSKSDKNDKNKNNDTDTNNNSSNNNNSTKDHRHHNHPHFHLHVDLSHSDDRFTGRTRGLKHPSNPRRPLCPLLSINRQSRAHALKFYPDACGYEWVPYYTDRWDTTSSFFDSDHHPAGSRQQHPLRPPPAPASASPEIAATAAAIVAGPPPLACLLQGTLPSASGFAMVRSADFVRMRTERLFLDLAIWEMLHGRQAEFVTFERMPVRLATDPPPPLNPPWTAIDDGNNDTNKSKSRRTKRKWNYGTGGDEDMCYEGVLGPEESKTFPRNELRPRWFWGGEVQ